MLALLREELAAFIVDFAKPSLILTPLFMETSAEKSDGLEDASGILRKLLGPPT